MKFRDNLSKSIHYIRKHGVLSLLALVVNIVFFRFYQTKFKSSSGLYLGRGFFVTGKRNISLGSNFRAGVGLRLEAIADYGEQGFSPSIKIGKNVTFNDYVHIGCVDNIEIGNNVLLASKIFISDHNHGCYSDSEISQHQSPEVPPSERVLGHVPVRIEDNVWIGEFVSVLPGSFIGRGSIIGANAVVNGYIPEYSIAVGNPARVVKSYDHIKKRWQSVSPRELEVAE